MSNYSSTYAAPPSHAPPYGGYPPGPAAAAAPPAHHGYPPASAGAYGQHRSGAPSHGDMRYHPYSQQQQPAQPSYGGGAYSQPAPYSRYSQSTSQLDRTRDRSRERGGDRRDRDRDRGGRDRGEDRHRDRSRDRDRGRGGGGDRDRDRGSDRRDRDRGGGGGGDRDRDRGGGGGRYGASSSSSYHQSGSSHSGGLPPFSSSSTSSLMMAQKAASNINILHSSMSSGMSSFRGGGGGGFGGGGGGFGGGRGGGGGGGKPRNEFGIAFGQPGAALAKPDWQSIKLLEFQKNFYREAPAISGLPTADVDEWRRKHDIVVIGTNVPRPIRSFEEAGFPQYIMTEIARAGFQNPTAIQSQGWPMAMSGRDVIGIAETGSGKTLAFLLPCIVHINAQPLLRSGDGPIVLVVAPTRELAMQIEQEVSKFAYSSKIKHCCVYGGVPRREQQRHLREGVEIVICTPGRLLDFLECSSTNLFRVTYLVIDEADRLLDMGFEPQLTAILSQVRPDRQILMWSATWPKEVQSLSRKYFLSGDVIQVSVGSALQDIKANHNVKQIVDCFDSQFQKQDKLYRLVRSPEYSQQKILVFSATKKQCNYLHRILRADGLSVCCIHGDKQQNERDDALAQFKAGTCSMMIATDVASRGIHINNIGLVINYDMPQNIEDYVHRIGRTGRCGNKGVAVSFFTRSDCKRAHKLISILREAKQEVPPKLMEYSQIQIR